MWRGEWIQVTFDDIFSVTSYALVFPQTFTSWVLFGLYRDRWLQIDSNSASGTTYSANVAANVDALRLVCTASSTTTCGVSNFAFVGTMGAPLLSGVVTSSSDGASLVVDGNTSTSWMSTADNWLQFALSTPAVISSYQVTGGSGTGWRLFVSVDGRAWANTDSFTLANSSISRRVSWPSGSVFARLTCSTPACGVSEMSVFGVPAALFSVRDAVRTRSSTGGIYPTIGGACDVRITSISMLIPTWNSLTIRAVVPNGALARSIGLILTQVNVSPTSFTVSATLDVATMVSTAGATVSVSGLVGGVWYYTFFVYNNRVIPSPLVGNAFFALS